MLSLVASIMFSTFEFHKPALFLMLNVIVFFSFFKVVDASDIKKVLKIFAKSFQHLNKSQYRNLKKLTSCIYKIDFYWVHKNGLKQFHWLSIVFLKFFVNIFWGLTKE